MSKNVNVNGVDYTGVSQVQLKTTDGGTAMFKDVDEIATPSGSVTITENGTHDVRNYAQAVVSVAISGDSSGEHELLKMIIEGNATGNIVLPSDVTMLKVSFSGAQITGIEMPSITYIGTDIFYNCQKLVLTELPPNLETIGQQAFYYAPKVNIAEIPASVNAIGKNAFAASGTKTLTFKGTPTGVLNASALAGVETVNVPWSEGAVANAPWGAKTVNYNYTGE